MLVIDDLHVSLGKANVLKHVSFSAKAGAVTCIVGPNGSGKTTTLRAVTGDVSFRGNIHLEGHALADLTPWEAARLRGVLPQASSLAFPFTVIEVVRLGLQSGESADDDTLALHALHRVGLGRYADRFYQDLSGGEQQRVQLARVLAQIPHPLTEDGARWLFLDEPVSSLDIAHQLQVMKIARDFAQGGGGVVAVMHDLNLTAMFADKIILLAEGRVVADGAPSDVLRDDTLSQAYGCALRVNVTPTANTPFLLPQAAMETAANQHRQGSLSCTSP